MGEGRVKYLQKCVVYAACCFATHRRKNGSSHEGSSTPLQGGHGLPIVQYIETPNHLMYCAYMIMQNHAKGYLNLQYAEACTVATLNHGTIGIFAFELLQGALIMEILSRYVLPHVATSPWLEHPPGHASSSQLKPVPCPLRGLQWSARMASCT